MWLMDYLTKANGENSKGTWGSISQSNANSVAVNASSEYRELPVAVPYGIAYCPPVGESSVVLPLADGQICLGVAAQDKGLQPGELMLFSAGGASVCLKNDGSVVINGQVFERNG